MSFATSARIRRFSVLAAVFLVSTPSLSQGTDVPAVDEQVAMALSAGTNALAQGQHEGLANALAVINRSGARPLPDWSGPDPVPEWRELVPDATAPMRGSPLGPGYRSGQVLARRIDKFEQVFLSGRKASIALSSPGSSPLSLRVLDADQKPVCTTENGTRSCRWVPLFTQRYVIEVRNLGNTIADYFLVVD